MPDLPKIPTNALEAVRLAEFIEGDVMRHVRLNVAELGKWWWTENITRLLEQRERDRVFLIQTEPLGANHPLRLEVLRWKMLGELALVGLCYLMSQHGDEPIPTQEQEKPNATHP